MYISYRQDCNLHILNNVLDHRKNKNYFENLDNLMMIEQDFNSLRLDLFQMSFSRADVKSTKNLHNGPFV